MTPHHFLFVAAAVVAQLGSGNAGTIEGVVANGTLNGAPAPGVEVVLRAGEEGMFLPVATTVTDLYGRFAFDQAPIEPGLIYLPGANRDGVHYPGPRIHLRPETPAARVALTVYDAVASPSPLIAERHEIQVRVEPGVLQVTETLTVSNPTATAYVGQARGEAPPVTLRLAIPQGFERVTFYEEFHGRRFYVIDGQAATNIPWPPGKRTLKFTYRVPAEENRKAFERTLDLPSANVRVVVNGASADAVECNLPRVATQTPAVMFASAGDRLPAGHAIQLRFGSLPTPWMAQARWGAAAILAVLIAGTAWLWGRPRRGGRTSAPSQESVERRNPAAEQKTPSQSTSRPRGSTKRAA